MSDGLIFDVDDAPLIVVRETGDVIADVEDAALTIDAAPVGMPGPKGDQGNPGPQGIPGDGATDPGDLTLIFDNQLI